jgi:hypothetical protein
VFWMAYGSTSGGLVRRLPFLKKCSIELGVKFLLSIHCHSRGAPDLSRKARDQNARSSR